jgi:tetratricopeptide (TPR) repeat protein
MADSPRIEELKRRVQSDPASIAFAALAEEYRRAGRFDEAIHTCTAGLVRHPSYLSAHVTLGRALLDVGRVDEARRELESVLKIAPENLAAIRALAEIHDRLREETHEQQRAPESASGEPAEAQMVAEIHAASGFTPAPAEAPEPAAHPVSAIGVETAPSHPTAWEAPVSAEAVQAIEIAAPVRLSADAPYEPSPAERAPEHTADAGSQSLAPQQIQARKEDPAVAELERFLHAIVRARAGRAECP